MEHVETLIVGAGASGLACASRFVVAGRNCLVLDRGRRPGGRASSRQLPDGRTMDLGVPLFRLGDPAVLAMLASLEARGRVVRWPGIVADRTGDALTFRDPDRDPRWTGAPSTGALLSSLAEGLPVRQEYTASTVVLDSGGWGVTCEDGARFRADALVLALPLPQARRLVADCPGAAFDNDACLVAALDVPSDAWLDWMGSADTVACYVHDDDLLALTVRRPGRPLVVHTSEAWSRPRLDKPVAAWAEELSQRLADRLGGAAAAVVHAHRWTFARPRGPLAGGCGWDPERRLAVCGDAWIGPTGRFEGALRSGLDAAGRVLGAV
jgi:predicted NAD/FAD-dependent oxidoreductase